MRAGGLPPARVRPCRGHGRCLRRCFWLRVVNVPLFHSPQLHRLYAHANKGLWSQLCGGFSPPNPAPTAEHIRIIWML